ncbi:hypothetical protein HHL11_23415 [Ramlibacter sp. G-1-2-2]|uniref:Membrane-anchored protein n=1 Tax=Ramlibacter agri TaxID=2728837 RepID=A0A848H9P0_9BURK|nr:hypothetical protein [Ramlibacter agri]NML46712.1 hypothetical protein [Ramlibacter agri]
MEAARPAILAPAFWNKVPAITLSFWVIKVLATTVGETGADYLAVHVGLGAALTTGLMSALLVAALLLQLTRHRYVPWIYWLTVVLLSVVSTQITDILADTLNVSLYVSTVVFSVLLAACFWIWHRAEGTLAINAIETRSRELFYWGAVLVTFALGTAAGDLATEALGLGFQGPCGAEIARSGTGDLDRRGHRPGRHARMAATAVLASALRVPLSPAHGGVLRRWARLRTMAGSNQTC